MSASLDTTNGWAYCVRASGVRWRDSDGSDVFIECCDVRIGVAQNVSALLSYLRGKSSRFSGSCDSLAVHGVRGTVVLNKDEEPSPIHSVPAPVATAVVAALRVEDVCVQVRAKRTVTREDSIVDPGAQAAGITCTLVSADASDVWLHRAALDVLFGGSTAAAGACLGGSVQLVPRAGAQHAEWRINQVHLQPSQLSAAGFVDETLLFPPLASLRATADVVVRASVLSEADAATRTSSVKVANKLGTGLVLGLLAGQTVNVELADVATRRIAEASAGDIALDCDFSLGDVQLLQPRQRKGQAAGSASANAAVVGSDWVSIPPLRLSVTLVVPRDDFDAARKIGQLRLPAQAAVVLSSELAVALARGSAHHVAKMATEWRTRLRRAAQSQLA